MELLDYLNHNFYTQCELLKLAQVSEAKLYSYQQCRIMPVASYQLTISVDCYSYFGEHQQDSEQKYYAKGYVEWLQKVMAFNSEDEALRYFKARYLAQVTSLSASGHTSCEDKFALGLQAHIESEWQHFLTGTYGLCTQSGLPEDIAAKEFAISQINTFQRIKKLDESQKTSLQAAIDLLDSVSAWFAPHERPYSSRYRLVDQLRLHYGFD